jgi:hypothetical protein
MKTISQLKNLSASLKWRCRGRRGGRKSARRSGVSKAARSCQSKWRRRLGSQLKGNGGYLGMAAAINVA